MGVVNDGISVSNPVMKRKESQGKVIGASSTRSRELQHLWETMEGCLGHQPWAEESMWGFNLGWIEILQILGLE